MPDQTQSDRSPTAPTSLHIAATLQFTQGVLMEALPFVGLLVLLTLGIEQSAVTARADIFALPFLQDNLYMMMGMSGVFAALRIVGAVGLWRNRMWGLALSVINCAVTLGLMIFMLPAGIVDGLLSGTALVLILVGWYGTTPSPVPGADHPKLVKSTPPGRTPPPDILTR